MTVQPTNVFEYEALARQLMPAEQYDFIAGGAADELTLERARHVLDSLLLRTRVLVDTSRVDMATSVLGVDMNMPVLLAPTGFHDRAHPDGEAASARAAAAAGVLMVVAVNGSRTLEETATAAAGPKWFQQGMYRDPRVTTALMERAVAAGYHAICITLDSPPYPPRRERKIRNNYRQRPSPNFAMGAAPQHEAVSAPQSASDYATVDNALTWPDFARLVAAAPLPIVAKGVMNADDAERCIESGVRAIIVSNHGARNLDATPAPIEVLPEVVARVGDQVEVLVDGGIRRGTDILKALALGARAVLIGRPIFWGLAVQGAAGVIGVLDILRAELLIAMAMCGQSNAQSVGADTVAFESPLTVFARSDGRSGVSHTLRDHRN